MSAADHRVVLSTIDDPERAAAIARVLVERRLVACVNIVGPIRSIYRWQGAVEEESEHLLIAKTRRERMKALREAIVELHPYDVPEVLELPVDGGHPAYLAWVDASVASAGD